MHRPSVASTKSQPKSVTIDSKGVAFVAGISSIEVFNSSQQVFQTEPKFSPASVAVADGVVAFGGDVRASTMTKAQADQAHFSQDMKVHLYTWDGQSLKDAGTLEGNKATVSALAFTPDGSLLAAGDVSPCACLSPQPLTANQSSGKIVLFNVKEKTVSVNHLIIGRVLIKHLGCYLTMVLPYCPSQFALIHSRWTTLRFWLARHACIRLVRVTPTEKYCCQECRAWRSKCCCLAWWERCYLGKACQCRCRCLCAHLGCYLSRTEMICERVRCVLGSRCNVYISCYITFDFLYYRDVIRL
jgi:hypothetical protein